MAQQGVHVDRETFSCFICLDLLKDPVTIPCGHSYCMNCIKSFWDGEDQKRIHSCPQCRKTFKPRPIQEKSTVLAALVEQLKKTGLQAAPADHRYAGPEDVACDICPGGEVKAIESCLFCLMSFCEKHLQPHYDSNTLKEHKLVEPNKNLQKNVCSRHNQLLEIFCRTDQKFICYLCSVDEHKGHDTVSAAAERTERQRELEERRGNIQQRIQDREKDVKLLQQEVEAINHSADKTVEDSKEIFTELIRLLRKRSSEVKQQIRSQQETEVIRVKDVEKKLQQEITELKRKDAELEQLSHTEDHNQFLLNYPSLPALSESTLSSSISIRPLRHFEDVAAAVSHLRDIMMDILRDSWTNISLMDTEDDLITEPEPITRDGFLKYSYEITLDPNTANTQLGLSEGNRKTTLMDQLQSLSSHPDRFTDEPQVLSSQRLTGRRYWEVDWSGKLVRVAVAYKSTSRAGRWNKSLFGSNNKSWALICSQKGFQFSHNDIWESISGPVSSRVGVDLDHKAGTLSFYRVSESMTLIHRVQTRFTEPLHAGVYVGEVWDSAQFCKPRSISSPL
ncbi:tripartite motif-containing protein 16-like [Poeciliopsis prolifica]|uniref:tripartite motif-containing protein 16-like n=1 Tax=Poeciliopsis prolifica TaxID=188132 RepID=UPI0024138735|nr:tripartite motif-containing protein 16-like [Poeciliopsis prolifica]